MTQHTPGPFRGIDNAEALREQRVRDAAPEMLAIIGEILDALNDLGERAYRVTEAINPELEKARALLARVEGKS